MKRQYRRYTKEMLENVVKNSCSYAECLKQLGLVIAGGNYKHLQRNIDKFGLDVSHMKHQASNQGREFKTFDDLMSNDAIKKRLVTERNHRCESCGLFEWLGRPITLELEHCNGNNRDNSRQNLKLFCPNCHSFTATWRGKNIK